MAQGKNDSQIPILIDALKQVFRARGLHYSDIATMSNVSERTVKRWLSGKGLTIQTVEELCELVDMSFIDLCEIAKRDIDVRPQRLNSEQERLLFDDLELAFVFRLLCRGWSPQELQHTMGMSDQTLTQHLSQLEKLRLLDLLPGNKVHMLFGRNIIWRKGGPAMQAFERGLKRLFATMDFREPGATWNTEVVNLSAQSVEQLSEKFRALIVDVQQMAERDRGRAHGNTTWYTLLVAAQTFDPLKLNLLSQ